MFKLTTASLLVGAVFLVSLGGTASGGHIPTPPCPKFKLCVYTDADYGGDLLTIGKRGVSNKIYGGDGPFNDAVSSVKNRRDRRSFLYEHTDGDGFALCLDPHRKISDLSTIVSPTDGLNFDDDASSSKNSKKTASCPG